MMTKKVKFTQRILNAVRALRGEPWPCAPVVETPPVEVCRYKIETFMTTGSVPLEYIDLRGPEVVATAARQDLADHIGRAMMDAGAVEVTKTADIKAGLLYFRAKVRVAMPEEVHANG